MREVAVTKSKHWMKKAFANSHGQFKAKAARAGKSTAKFAREKASAPGRLGKEARLAEVGMAAHHKKSRSEKWYS